jgi:hypothetical protein
MKAYGGSGDQGIKCKTCAEQYSMLQDGCGN